MIETNFKHTDIGLIPHDWEVKTLGEVGYLQNGFAYNSRTFGDMGYTVIRISDIRDGKIVLDDAIKSITKAPDAFIVKKGDFLIAMSGATTGKIGLYFNEFSSYINQRVGNIICVEADSGFVRYSFNSICFAEYLKTIITAGAQPNISKKQIEEFAFPIPPTLAEQERIAGALSNIDTLIGALNEQIEKKRHIKQGTMQQLLTGKKRLAGFTGEWKSVRLGDVTDIRTGKRNGDENVKNAQYPFFVRSQTIYRINTYSYDGEAILIPGEGGIGSIFHYINGKFDYHQRVYKISDFADGIYAKYVYFYMKYSFGVYAMQNTVKATVDSLRLPIFQDFMVSIPPTIAEQSAIAAVLSGMDTEIAALEQKRDKYMAIKQGMMQNLLTGKIRLI